MIELFLKKEHLQMKIIIQNKIMRIIHKKMNILQNKLKME